MDIAKLRELYNSHAAREAAIRSGAFTHLTNANLTGFNEGQYCFSGPFIVHDPQGTKAFSAQKLKEMGLIGIYHQAGRPITNYDDRMFRGDIAEKIRAESQRQSLTWGWHKVFGTESIHQAVCDDFEQRVRTMTTEHIDTKPKLDA